MDRRILLAAGGIALVVVVLVAVYITLPTAPTVSSTVPSNTATDVAFNASITATFSEAMDPSTITTTTFTLKQGATPVSGAVAYAGTTATFDPTNDLATNTTYTATITTESTDLAGNALASEYVWSFTTGSVSDTTAPTVISTVPSNTNTGVATNANITAIFSEVMDPLTTTTATFTLMQGATPVSGAMAYAGTTATFDPTNDLATNTTYTATITTESTDLAGNALASEYVWSFTTAATIAVLPANPTASYLGEAGRFVILAAEKVTTTVGSVISNGDVVIEDEARTYYEGFTPGVSPGQFIELTNGLSYAHDDTDPALIPSPYASTIAFIDQVRTDVGNAYTYLAAQTLPAPAAIPGDDPTELGGKTLYRGIYVSAIPVKIEQGDLTLDAQGDPDSVWIFQLGDTLTTGAPGGNIILANGAQAKNVYFQVGASTVIGAGTTFYGNVLSWSQINVTAGANITGRLFALTEQVTLISDVVTKAP